MNQRIRGWRPVIIAAAILSGAVVTGQKLAVSFTDIIRDAGVSFTHVNGASPDKHLVETMGSGAVFFDYDNDGWIDLFLVDGGSVADPAVARQARHRLFRNRGNGTFEDATSQSGIRHREYGMGACAGDYDNDGRVDLYVTNFGANILYHNAGNGTFEDVTRTARVGTPSSWSTGCAFADLDKDGDLDLFVTNYVAIDVKHSPFCGNARLKLRSYCHPLIYEPLPNVLYRNDGNGMFTDVSAQSGVGAHRGNGLGVLVADFDDDGWPEVFVANDSMPNFLFRRAGESLRFDEIALRAGVAVATDGRARAGMGVDAGDYNGDGRLDLVVTNLDSEMNSLYRSLGPLLFAYATPESGTGPATLPFVGFGVVFFDVDNDALLDLAVANGHIFDNAPLFRAGATYAQRNLLFRNTGTRFADVSRSAGPGFAIEKVSRGLIAGDIDNDGDLDLLVTNNGQTADLLRNDGGNSQNSLLVRLIGVKSNRDAIGARLRLTSAGHTQVREVKSGSSYLSQSDPRVHFGLGRAARAERLEVRWPSGRLEILKDLPANHIVSIREGDGVVRAVPFVR